MYLLEQGRIWKIIQTLWLFWGYFIPGISNAVLGPTLIDLALMLSEGTERVSYLALVIGIGTIFGSILAPVFTPFDIRLRLSISILLASIINIALPMVSDFVYLVVMFTLHGILKDILVVYSFELCNTLWKEKGVPFQFVTIGATVGSLITPLVAGPFLCHKQDQKEDVPLEEATAGLNLTGFTHNLTDRPVCTAKNTHVHLAYVILGCITLPSAVAFAYYWIRYRNDVHDDSISSYESLESTTKVTQNCIFYVFLLFLFIYFFPAISNTVLYSTFLTAYGVYGPLQLTKGVMIQMTFVLFACGLIGRICNTLWTPFLGIQKVVFLNCIAIFITAIFLVILGPKFETAMWICTAAFGFFQSPLLAASFAWTAEEITIDTKILAFCVFAVSIGNTVLPALGGIFFENIGPVSYIYLVSSITVIQALMFVVLFVLARLLKRANTQQENSEKEKR